MKSVVVVVGLYAMLAVHVAAGGDMADFKQKIDKCKSKSGISDEAAKKLKPFQVPQTHEEECYLGCMNHELETVFPNNTLNIEQIKLMLGHVKEKNPDFYEKSIKVAEICASKITANSDDCAAAKIILECHEDEGAKIGLKMPGH